MYGPMLPCACASSRLDRHPHSGRPQGPGELGTARTMVNVGYHITRAREHCTYDCSLPIEGVAAGHGVGSLQNSGQIPFNVSAGSMSTAVWRAAVFFYIQIELYTPSNPMFER